jgi:hypothetical protein
MKTTHIIRAAFFTLLAVFLVLISPTSAFAVASDLVSAKMDPVTPGPNQTVTISIESFAANINSARIVWYVNREPRKEGVGEKTFTFTLGDFGSVSTVDIIILTPEGAQVKKQLVIAPTEIDILWEAQTYTPPFYKGKALPSYKSILRVSAIPRYNSLSSNPDEYTYKWMYNRTENAGGGLGKDRVVIPSGWSDSAVPVTLEVKLPNSPWIGGSAHTSIAGSKSKVLLYENAPLLGTQFNHALKGSNEAAGNEFTIRAVPYFFSTDNYMNNELVYTWKLGGGNAVPGQDPTNFVLTKKGRAAEFYQVSLRVQNPRRILQEGIGGASVSFAAEN